MLSGTLGAAVSGSVIAASAPGFAGQAVATGVRVGFVAGFAHAAVLGAAISTVAALVVAATIRRVS